MKIAERVDELQRTLNALMTGASGWPPGLIDIAVKRIETSIEVLWLSDEELSEISAQYQEMASRSVGSTSAALMIEIARRSILSAHERIAETKERTDVG